MPKREPTSWQSKVLFALSWIVIIVSVWALFVNPGVLTKTLFPPVPCSAPISYSFGSIDPRFGVSTSTVEQVVETAANLWSVPVGKPLFAEDPKGALKINLVYDDRQAATDKLKKLGFAISDDKASYDSLKAKYVALKATLASKQKALDAQVQDYNTRSAAFDAEVSKWNARGGAPPEVYAKLQQEKQELDAEAASIRKAEADANTIVDQINAMVTVLNRMAAALNLEAVQANTVSLGRGESFEEGEYRVDQYGNRTVTIYEFESMEKLDRVMAHELGHALGLDHVDDPTAIMYYLNQGNADKLSAADTAAIRALCRVN